MNTIGAVSRFDRNTASWPDMLVWQISCEWSIRWVGMTAVLAFTHARRVDKLAEHLRQRHLGRFIIAVLLRLVLLTVHDTHRYPLVIQFALGAEVHRHLVADVARLDGRSVACQESNCASINCYPDAHVLQLQQCLGRTAEVVLVSELAWSAGGADGKDIVQRKLHWNHVDLPVSNELWHVATALDPDDTQKRVELLESWAAAYFQVEPVLWLEWWCHFKDVQLLFGAGRCISVSRINCLTCTCASLEVALDITCNSNFYL